MKSGLYTIRDDVMAIYNNPFAQINDATAIRSFNNELERGGPDSLFSSHPADFSLYRIGYFDNESGCLTVEPVPTLVIAGRDLARRGEGQSS